MSKEASQTSSKSECCSIDLILHNRPRHFTPLVSMPPRPIRRHIRLHALLRHPQMLSLPPLLVQPEEPTPANAHTIRLRRCSIALFRLRQLRQLGRRARLRIGLARSRLLPRQAQQTCEERGEDGKTGADDADGLLDRAPDGGGDEGVGDVCGDDFCESGHADDGRYDDAGNVVSMQV